MASNLSVNVTANTTDLRAGLALAQADLKAFGAETRQLANSIRAGGDSTGALRGQLQSVAAQFNRAKIEVVGLTANLRTASGAAREHSAAISSMGTVSKSIAGISTAVSGVVGALGAMKGALGPVGAAIVGAFAVQHIIQTTREIAKLGETTENSADLLGVSVESFSRLSGAMQIAGADSETATRNIEKLGRMVLDALKDPAGSAAVAFDNLGIKMSTVKAKGNDTEAMLGVVADAWISHEKGLLRSGAGYELLGRGMDKIIPLLNRGSRGVKELGDQAESTGSVLSAKTAKALAETDDKFDKLGQTIRGSGIAVFKLFKPAIDGAADALTFLAAKFTESIDFIERWALKARIAIFNVRNAIYQLGREQGETMVGPRGLIPDEAGPAPATGTEKVGTRKAGGGGGGGKDDRLSEWRDELRQKLQAEQNFFKDSKEDELAFWQAKAAIVQQGTGKEEIKLRREVNAEIFKLQKELAQQTQKDRLEELDYKIRVYDQEFAAKKAQIDGEVALGRISAEEGIARERALLDQKEALDEEYNNRKLSAAAEDLETTVKLSRDKYIAHQDYLNKIEALNIKAAEASKAAWEKVFEPLESAFDTAIKGYIQGTTSLYDALLRAGQTIFLDPFLKNLTNGLKAAFAEGFGSEVSGGAGGGILGGVSKFLGGNLISSLITGGGETAASGDALASIFAAAESVPLVFNRGGIVPSAAGGWMVPQTAPGGVLANLHSKEMVLPADISQGLQAMLAGGSSSTSNRSQAINLTYSPTVNAPEHMGLHQLLSRDSRAMTGFIQSRIRDGALEAPGGWMR